MIAIGADRFRSRAAASPESGAGSGGHVDDLSKRLGAVETGVAEIRGEIRHLATKADLQADIGSLRSAMEQRMHAMEVRMITWMVGTMLSTSATAIAIAKYFIR